MTRSATLELSRSERERAPAQDIADEFLSELDEARMSFAPYITHGPPAGTAAPREGANVVQNP